MNREEFNQSFEKLSLKQKNYLSLFLQGKTDQEIDRENKNKQGAFKKALETIIKDFGLRDEWGANIMLRDELIDLFCKFKPELVAPHLLQTRNKQDIKPNPFGYRGKLDDPKLFYGREELLHQIFEDLSKGQSISLVGESEIGKSSIMSMICKTGVKKLNYPSEAFIYIDMQRIHQEENFWKSLYYKLGLRELYLEHGHDVPELEDELQKRQQENNIKRYIICIDELEKMTDKSNFSLTQRETLRSFANGANEPFSLVTASFSPIDILFPDWFTSPFDNIFLHKPVNCFSTEEAQGFLKFYLLNTGVTFTEDQISELLEKTQCHPAKLQQEAYHLYNTITQKRG